MEKLIRKIKANVGTMNNYKRISEDKWDFAACCNRDCPQHSKNGGEPNKHYPMYSNGKYTLCGVCLEELEHNTNFN